MKKIKFGFPIECTAKLTVYDILGRIVKTLVNGKFNAGYHAVEFDGSNLPSGIYFYRIQTEKFREVKKMIMMK